MENTKDKKGEEELTFQLKRLQEDLDMLQRYIEELSIFLPYPVCMVNPANIVLDINKAFQNLTGYGEKDIVGENTALLFKEKNKFLKIILKLPEEAKNIEKEFTLLSKNKKEVPVAITFSARRDKDGEFIGYFFSITDITEIKKFKDILNKKIIQKTKELQKRINEMEKFYKLTIGRELKMVELKKELEEVRSRLETSQLEK